MLAESITHISARFSTTHILSYELSNEQIQILSIIFRRKIMKNIKKNTSTQSEKIPKLNREDGQSEKLEEKKVKVKKGF